MFSGITNQFSNLLGKSGEGGEAGTEAAAGAAAAQPAEISAEVQPALVPDAVGVEGAEAGAEGKAAGVFSGVSSKMTGWLSNAPSIPSMPAMPNISMPSMPSVSIPSIPGLRKTQTTDEGAGGIVNEGLVATPEGHAIGGDQQAAATGGAGSGNDEDDRSRYISATGGADSRPNSPIQDEEAGQIGNVTTKITGGVKSFGSFLSSTVGKVGDRMKETVIHNPILDKFNKEQDAFIKSQGGNQSGACPWVGHKAEEKIKEEIMALSADRRNFVRAPPAGVEYEFNYDQSYPVALAIMNEDKQLEQMRFDLVPKIITEENFWRNYFYRVSLIVEAGDLGTLGSENEFTKRASSEEANGKSATEKVGASEKKLTTTAGDCDEGRTQCVVATDVKANAKVQEASDSNHNRSPIQLPEDLTVPDTKTHKISESEFISDTLQASEADMEEVKAGMKKLGIDTLASQALDTKSGKIVDWFMSVVNPPRTL